jgi:hypothetical protein
MRSLETPASFTILTNSTNLTSRLMAQTFHPPNGTKVYVRLNRQEMACCERALSRIRRPQHLLKASLPSGGAHALSQNRPFTSFCYRAAACTTAELSERSLTCSRDRVLAR